MIVCLDVRIPIRTHTGVKQGDPVADVVFMGVFARIVDTIRRRLAEENITIVVRMKDGTVFGDAEADTRIDIMEITYVDDMLIFITANNCSDLLSNVKRVVQVVKEGVATANFTVNMSKGKSEVMLKLRGKGALDARRAIQDERSVKIDDGSTIGVVSSYAHLGSTCADNLNGKFVMDFKRRLQTKRKEYSNVLRHKGYTQDVKKKVVNIVMSAALYSAQAVTRPFSKGQMKQMESCYHALIREATGTKYNPHDPEPISDHDMRIIYGYPSLDTVLRLRRLAFLPALLKRAPSSLKGLMQDSHRRQGIWSKLLKADMEWLGEHRGEEGPGSRLQIQDLEAVEKFIMEREEEWRRMLNKVYQDDIEGLVYLGLEVQDQPGDAEVLTCSICGQEAKNARALALHKKKKHGRRTMAQLHADGKQCSWCQTLYSAREGLLRHLRGGYSRKGVASCLAQLQLWGAEQLDEDELARQLETDRRRCADNRRRGDHPQAACGVHRKGCGPVRELREGPVQFEIFDLG
eukprot:TRINITY_DN52996_c0_g1_i6.p1 TRINITY_DN52996_c0_g1~~TRINITY_DN52996_c0_g1_i6.p1  ORF type:complete len:519 (-),score=95.64 TRINITY_DN52996_c0_g1_i6:224-1780(-)